MAGISAYAQNCGSPHTIFREPTDKTPAVIEKIGTAPQFEPLRHLTSSAQVYSQLKAMANDKDYGTEVNNLFNALGYNGVNDPAFGPDDVKAEQLPFGAMGMLGSAGNTYKYSMLAVPGQTKVDAWHITAANAGCDLYFVSECGNAFHYSNKPTEAVAAAVVVKEKVVKDYSGTGKVKVKVYARYQEEAPCTWCTSCATPDDGYMVEQTALIAEEEIDRIPVADDDSGYPVKKLYVDVDKKTFKKVKEYYVVDSDKEREDQMTLTSR